MKTILLLLFFFNFSILSSPNAVRTENLIEDFDYLISELRVQHQGLYQYVDKNQVDKEIDSIRTSLTSPKTKLAFYKMLRYTIGLTNEGHTSIDLPTWSMLKVGLPKSILPLSVKFCGDKLLITQNFGKNSEGLTKGVQLVAVNGKEVGQILKDIFPLIPTDGFNQTSKYAWAGGINFALLYRMVYGKEQNFELKIREFGSSIIKTVSIPPIRYTSFKGKNAKFKSIKFDYNRFKFEQINDSIAYLSIPSFGDDQVDYETFYKSNFEKIASLNIKHLILDFQSNGGGTEGNENLLFGYLSDTVFQKYKQVTMLSKPYQKNKNEEDYIFDKWKLKGDFAQRGKFTLMSNYYSNLGYKNPLKELIFTGKIYVLTSGKTYSGGAEFASLVKMTKRGIFIGKETGGTYQGNVSGYSETIELPNSKIKVSIPTVHFQIDVAPKIKGRGIMPDYEVTQTWADYLNAKNTKKDFAVKLIKNPRSA